MTLFDTSNENLIYLVPKKNATPPAHNFDPLGILLLNFWEDKSQLVLYLIAKLCPNLKFGGNGNVLEISSRLNIWMHTDTEY